MKQYLDLLEDVLEHGDDRMDRTGVGTRAMFGKTMRFRMEEGFPAITTKKLAFKSMVAELIWFLKGSSDVKELQALGCHIWDANAESDYWKPKAKFEGDLGRVYGAQWRSWRGSDGKVVDQIKGTIESIKNKPYDRRHIVTAWNPAEIDMVALPPCHMFFQFFVEGDRLSILMHQRSCDMFLGVPFNIASYSLLLHMVAQVTGFKPGEFIHILGDTHIYKNHFDQVKEQLQRTPYPLPRLWLNPAIKDINDFGMDDIRLENYQYHPSIKAKMAV